MIRRAQHILEDLIGGGLVVGVDVVLPRLLHEDVEDPARGELHVHVLRVGQILRVVE